MTTDEALKIINNPKAYHRFYEQSCKYAKDIAIHADDEPAGDLVAKRRPKESKEIQDYREAIRIAKTEAPVSKVITSLAKIRKSQDWAIKYPKTENIASKIAADETLQNYMENDFPRYTSFTNWFFSVCFKQYLIDANAVSMLIPQGVFDDGYKAESNQYLEPYPTIFNSEQILDYSQKHYLLKSDEINIYTKERTIYEGKIYYLIDENIIYEIKEVDPKPAYKIATYDHNLGILPIVKLGGVVKKELKNICLYKSRISPMIPELKEALREYSDLQAEIVQHIHSTLWTIGAQQCTVCGGTGKVIGAKDSPPIKCKSCKGKGIYPFNPFEHFEVRQPKAGETPIPTPPAGFINKQIDIAILQDKRVQDHIYYALSAINFEFLATTPLNQSGKAKEIDRAEIDNFTNAIAEDVVKIIDDHYFITNEYRYRFIIANAEDREKLLPSIPVPQKYDILSEEFIIDEIAKARTSNLNRAITNAVEIEYAHKKFGNDNAIRDFIINCIELDPFASEPDDMLVLKLQNNGISKLKYIVHCNIKDFVQRATEENKDFLTMSFLDKQKIIEKYAQQEIDNNTPSGKVIKLMNSRQPNDRSFNVGDNVKIMNGKEKNPSIANVSLPIAKINDNGTADLSMPDGTTDTYNMNDLMAA